MNKTKVLAITIAIATVLSTTAFAMQNESGNSKINKNQSSQQRKGGMMRGPIENTLKTSLATLVTANTLTQVQADAIVNAITPQKPAEGTKPTTNPQPREDMMKKVFDGFVTSGTITKDQEAIILKAILTSMPQPINKPNKPVTDGSKINPDVTKVRPDTIKPMIKTDEIKSGIRPEKGIAKQRLQKDILNKVEKGVINPKVAIAKDFEKCNPNTQIKTIFDGLVKAGSITQAQATTMVNAMTAEKPKVEAPQNFLKIKIDALVVAGTITQAQADAVLKLLPQAKAHENNFNKKFGQMGNRETPKVPTLNTKE